MNGFQCISFGIPDVRESILLCACTIVGSGVISTSETQIHFVRVVMIDANKLFMGEYDNGKLSSHKFAGMPAGSSGIPVKHGQIVKLMTLGN